MPQIHVTNLRQTGKNFLSHTKFQIVQIPIEIAGFCLSNGKCFTKDAQYFATQLSAGIRDF